MSVVKKYQSGGKASKAQSIEEYLAEKINKGKFTAKALPYVREAATNFANLANSGKLNEIYSHDKINSTYAINSDLLPEELKSVE